MRTPLLPLAALGAALAATILLGCAATVASEETPDSAQGFTDPRPPQVQDLVPAEAPPPTPNRDVTFHKKPKPLPASADASGWPSFLGPDHNATSPETGLLGHFPPSGPPLVWEMESGAGYSSPAILGERLVYLHRVGSEERVECLHPETGERYWSYSYATTYRDRYGYSNGPRASPVISGDRVFTVGAQGQIHCLRLDTGQLYWRRDLGAEFEVPQDFFGTASTPLIDSDLLIVQVGAPGGPTVVAFDQETGKMVWGAGDQWGPSYASPIPATIRGKRRVLVFAGGESRPPTGGLLSLDPANGRIDFAFPWRSKTFESVNASCPVAVGNQVFVSATYRTGSALLNILPDGGHELAWTNSEFDLHWSTAIHENGHLYGFAGRNEPDASLMCLNLQSGKTVWRAVLEWQETAEWNGEERSFSASPLRGSLLLVDGRFLALGELGHLMWLDLKPSGHKILSRTRLFLARETWSLPVLSRGLLYVSQNRPDMVDRTPPRLLCYDLRGGPDKQ